MTSIDDLQHDLQNVSDNVLSSLSPDEHLRVLIQEVAEGRDERIEWLGDAAPRREYRAVDPEYKKRIHMAFDFSLSATYTLHTWYLRWQLKLAELETLAVSRPDFRDAVVDREESVTVGERDVATRLYIEYRAHERFAHEHLDTSLEELLALSRSEFPDLELADVVDEIEERGWVRERVGSGLLGDGEDAPLEIGEAVERRCEALIDDWEYATENY
jgi:hypothetical protein